LQHVTKFEGKNEGNTNSKNELSNAFVTLLINIINKDTLYSFDSETFFTLIKGKSIVLYAKSLINSFNN
jgi:hypothetical protein